MMQQVIVQRDVLIDAPLDHVWQLVATEEGLLQWWGNRIYLEAKEGGHCEEWRNDRLPSVRWQGVVTTFAPPHQLMLTMRAKQDQFDVPTLTTISITLEAKNNGEQTCVHVTQRLFGARAATDVGGEEGNEARPKHPLGVPLAQLQRPAPGAYPMPQATASPTIGTISHSSSHFTNQQSDALALIWQQRLNALSEGISNAK